MVSDKTVEINVSKTVSLKITGDEKCRLTVGEATKGDFAKMRPNILGHFSSN